MDFEDQALLADRMHYVQRAQRRLSHDLRGSLNALGLNVDLLAASLEDSADDRQLRYLDTLRRTLADFQAELTRTMSLLQSWAGDSRKFDAAQTLGQVVKLLSGTARARGVNLVSKPPAATLELNGHRQAMAHALLALTWQAIEAAGKGRQLEVAASGRAGEVSWEWRIEGESPRDDPDKPESQRGEPLPRVDVARAIFAAHGGRLGFPRSGQPWAIVTPRAHEIET